MANKDNLTIRQEKFAQEYVKTSNASQSFINSYDTTNYKRQSIYSVSNRILKNVKVQRRINELKALIQERYLVSIDSVTSELEEARTLARSKDDASPMITASVAKAKLHGLMTDKRETTIIDNNRAPIQVVLVQSSDHLKQLSESNSVVDEQ